MHYKIEHTARPDTRPSIRHSETFKPRKGKRHCRKHASFSGIIGHQIEKKLPKIDYNIECLAGMNLPKSDLTTLRVWPGFSWQK